MFLTFPILIALAAASPDAAADEAQEMRSQRASAALDESACLTALASSGAAISPQPATIDDTRIFARSAGEFRSATQKFDDGVTEYYFTVKYDWFDRNRTIMRVVVSMTVPSQGRTITSLEGFYGYDPFLQQLYVFGAFSDGTTGWGAMGAFDHESGARAVWAVQQGPDGVITHVRDEFALVSENVWKNRTRICTEDTGAWRLASEGTYTRVSE
jgi:hypothetical protein